jgi:hypothetical protein
MLIVRGEEWLVRQSVEGILGIPARIENPSMRVYEVIIHHLDVTCGATWRIARSYPWEFTGMGRTFMR